MKKATFATVAIAFALFLSTNAYTTDDLDPPADWDLGGHDVNAELEEDDYEIVWTGHLYNGSALSPDPKSLLLLWSGIDEQQESLCIGIIKYKTHAYDPTTTEEVEAGNAWAFFATPRKQSPGAQPPYEYLDCGSLTSTAFNPRRPVFVFLHGYPGEGSFFNAVWNALYIKETMHIDTQNPENDDPYPFVISISGPGAGKPVYSQDSFVSYNCVDDCNNTDPDYTTQPPECRIPCEQTGLYQTDIGLNDLRSFGYEFNPQPTEFLRGFKGIGEEGDPQPD